MRKKIKIGNKEVDMKASAATPMLYRECFKDRDILIEIMQMERSEGEDFEGVDMGMFERIAYVMSGAFKKQDFERWLDQFGPMDIVEAAPDIMGLWYDNDTTQAEERSLKNE